MSMLYHVGRCLVMFLARLSHPSLKVQRVQLEIKVNEEFKVRGVPQGLRDTQVPLASSVDS